MRDLAEVCSGIAPGTLQTLKILHLNKSLHLNKNPVHECNKSCLKCCYKAAALRTIGRILRSACPTSANQQDVDLIRKKLKITHLVSCIWCLLSASFCMLCESLHCHSKSKLHILPLGKCLDTLFVQSALQYSDICTTYMLETASRLVVVRVYMPF